MEHLEDVTSASSPHAIKVVISALEKKKCFESVCASSLDSRICSCLMVDVERTSALLSCV